MICRLCGASETEEFLVEGLRYIECAVCSYIALAAESHPRRSAELQRYRLHHNDPEDVGYRAFLRQFIERAVVPFVPAGTTVLDFGSGPVPAMGGLLEEGGRRCRAYDPFFAPSEAWRRRRWECVILHEVAEHLKCPGRTFGAIARRLEPGAVLAIRTRFAPERREDFASWWYRRDPTHVGFFSARSLARLAEILGLEILRIETPDLAVFRAPRSVTRASASCPRARR